MSSTDRLASILDAAFARLVSDGVADVVNDPDDLTGHAYEIQADDWTLFVKGAPVERAWIAVDAESAQASTSRHELEHALTADDVDAMLALDLATEGSLLSALRDSRDPLSIELGVLLEECRNDDQSPESVR